MKNTILNKFDSFIKIKISGKNIERFIKRLYNNKINIYDMKKINRNKIVIKIHYNDYDKVLKLKTIYEVSDVDLYGIVKIKKIINKNRFMIIFMLFSYFLIMILSNVIFKINIIHSSSEIRNLINIELNKYNIKKYSFKKSYKDLEKIKNEILKNNKDKLEWISIENVGTTVKVRVEERILNSKEEVYENQNIVAVKDGIIRKIDADEGFIKYEINDFVKKGDVLISGEIYNPSGKFLGLTKAIGDVYAEVWYEVKIIYPLIYNEKNYTGRKDINYELLFISNRFGINNKKFKNYDEEYKIILENKLLPIKFIKSTKKEVDIIDNVNTYETALIEAEKKAKDAIEERLGENEKILSQKTLSFLKKDSTIEVDIFFSVMEHISESVKLNEEDYINQNEIGNEEKEE